MLYENVMHQKFKGKGSGHSQLSTWIRHLWPQEPGHRGWHCQIRTGPRAPFWTPTNGRWRKPSCGPAIYVDHQSGVQLTTTSHLKVQRSYWCLITTVLIWQDKIWASVYKEIRSEKTTASKKGPCKRPGSYCWVLSEDPPRLSAKGVAICLLLAVEWTSFPRYSSIDVDHLEDRNSESKNTQEFQWHMAIVNLQQVLTTHKYHKEPLGIMREHVPDLMYDRYSLSTTASARHSNSSGHVAEQKITRAPAMINRSELVWVQQLVSIPNRWLLCTLESGVQVSLLFSSLIFTIWFLTKLKERYRV